jgi:carbon monoxide dehydrogenase subunit G
LRVKVGPIVANLEGTLTVLERHAATFRTVASAEAKDRRISGDASVTAHMTLIEAGPDTTELIVQAHVRFLGKLGEFGEPIIRRQRDIAVASFARNVAAQFHDIASNSVAPGIG